MRCNPLANSDSKLTTSVCATAARERAESDKKSFPDVASNSVSIELLMSAIILAAALIV